MLKRTLLLCLLLFGMRVSVAFAQELTPIEGIQGDGTASQIVGRVLTVRGVVTGFYASTNSRGNVNHLMFLQTVPGEEDGNAETSDGIAVYIGRNPPTAKIGDVVTIDGEVIEFYGLTEISGRAETLVVEASDQPLPDAIQLEFPTDEAERKRYFESLEGMRVTLGENGSTVAELAANCRFKLLIEGNTEETDIVLPVLNHTDVVCDDLPDLAVGERVVGVEGPLTFNFDEFKIVQQHPISLTIVPTVTVELTVEPPPLPPIGSIQGAGAASPLVDEIVEFEGVVTGIHEDRNAAGAIFYSLFVQDLVGREDGDPKTSDAIALFLATDRPTVSVGDHVVVKGQVIEYFGLTEIAYEAIDVRIQARDVPLPNPIELAPTVDAATNAAYFESLEGMRVTTGAEPVAVVGPTYAGCGFAVAASANSTKRVIRQREEDAIASVIPILNFSDVSCTGFPQVKVGDAVSGLTGPLTYNFEQYRLIVQNLADVVVDVADFASLPVVPSAGDEQFSVVSFNVENFFDDVDDTGVSAEPKPSLSEIAQKRQKIAYAIGELLNCPTIVAIQEVEKEALLVDLSAEMQPTCDFLYEVVHLESADARGIDVAYLVQPERVEVLSAELQQACTPIETGIVDTSIECTNGQSPLFSRPPLRLNVEIEGREFTIFNNHFKSKRGGAAETQPRRVAQAQHLNRLVGDILNQDSDAQILVMGDFNDYELSAPLLTLEDGGLFNALSLVPQAERYTFIFNGVAQLIDGLLVSPALENAIAAVDIVHTNADYPDSLGGDLSAEKIPYKSTDHDIPILLINLGQLVPEEIEPSPTPVPTVAVTSQPTEMLEEAVEMSAPQERNFNPYVVGIGGIVLAVGIGYGFGRKSSQAK